MIGTVLAERYEIIEEVGIGGMAIVYKAEDLLLRRQVAVKILKEQFSEDPEFSDKFEVEAQSAASLSHPNIVSIYDVGSEKIEDRNIQYIVMELIQGRSLKEIIIEKGQLSNEETVYYSTQIAQALKAAHKNNIIHRDIKPQNIMITDEGMAKVTDFGIARISTSATITYTSSILGTVHYISPEQAKGKFIDNKSDLYSLGIMMYEMVTGKVPFDAENSVGIALKHIQDELIPPKRVNPGVSDKLNNIIIKCLEKNPADRFDNAEELIQALNSDDIYEVTDLSDTQVLDPVADKDENVSVYKTRNKSNRDKEDNDNNTARNIGITALLALICVTIGFFIFSAIRDNISEVYVEVPNVMNVSEDQAIEILESNNLNYNIIRRVNENVLEGFVFEQNPQPGEEISENSYVDLVVSDGLEEKIMPDLIGLNLEVARNSLNAEGMSITSERYEESSQAPGTIIGQSPEAGEDVSSQTQISVVVSEGESDNLVTMPSLLGSSQTTAVSTIIDNGLVVGDIDRMYSDEYPEGTVMWQSYDEGTSLEPETSIDFIVSQGPVDEPEVDLPDNTIDLTGGSEGDKKIYTFTLHPPTDREEFNLRIVRNGNEIVYEQNHGTGSTIELNFLDFTDSTYEVYYDDQLVASTN